MEIRISRTVALACILAIIGITLRLVPHTANFAPIGAIALFGGAILGKRLALLLPLAIMIVSDLFLGLHGTILFTWTGFAAIALFGMLFRDRPFLARVPAGALGSAAIFFIVSNFGVWLEGKLYPPTWQGLVDCYAMALPFLRPTLLSDLAFSTLLFGVYALAGSSLRSTITLRTIAAWRGYKKDGSLAAAHSNKHII